VSTQTPWGCPASLAMCHRVMDHRGPISTTLACLPGPRVEEVLPATWDSGQAFPRLQLWQWPPDYGHGLRWDHVPSSLRRARPWQGRRFLLLQGRRVATGYFFF
jgi:hypothetical protein